MHRSDVLFSSTERALSRKALWLSAAGICLFYALLWSPWWYPLSDSALYLNMARALARGKGLEAMRQMHRDVRPMTPMLLCGIMKLGGGIGAIHAAMIALMLLSHALAFLSLREWFNERTALMATLATATSWWVYSNAFSIMTEPLFLVMFWGAMWALSRVPGSARGLRWALVTTSALLMAGAWENRAAAAFLLPGMMFGLWMSNRDISWRDRAGWVAVFAIVFGVLAWDFLRPAPGAQAAAAKEETYHLNWLVGIRNPVVELPVSAGRWVIEGLAAAAGVPFEMPSKWLRATACVAVAALFALACIGWWKLWRGKHWYAVGMALFFIPHLVLWGARIKPRYMEPIAPVLFIGLCMGIDCVAGLWRKNTAKPRSGEWRAILLATLLVMNGVPYFVELYIRRGTSMNFYDVARRGGFAELVDIGAYVQKHAGQDEVVDVNWPPPSSRPPDAVFAPDRRIVQFLTDREVRFLPAKSGSGAIDAPADRERLNAYLDQVEGNWAVVYYSGRKWPSYHLPLIDSPRTRYGPTWWQLFHRDGASRRFEPIDVPMDREYVRGIPGWQR